jgi:hypothetical protein
VTPADLPTEFEQLLRRVQECSRDEKRVLLDRVLRDLLGAQPEREYGLYNPDGSSYLFLVPPEMRQRWVETPEFVAELDQRSRNPGQPTPLSELIARLQTLQ